MRLAGPPLPRSASSWSQGQRVFAILEIGTGGKPTAQYRCKYSFVDAVVPASPTRAETNADANHKPNVIASTRRRPPGTCCLSFSENRISDTPIAKTTRTDGSENQTKTPPAIPTRSP